MTRGASTHPAAGSPRASRGARLGRRAPRSRRRTRRVAWASLALALVAALILLELLAGVPFGPVYWFRQFGLVPADAPGDDTHIVISATLASFSGRVGGIPVTFYWVNTTGARFAIETAPTGPNGAVSIAHKPPSVGQFHVLAAFRVPGSSETVTSPTAYLVVQLPPTL
jgi:hypothetical protein